MADHSQTLAIIVTAKDLASGNLAKANRELAKMGTGGKIAAVGLGTGIKAVNTAEGAARHLGGVLSGLAGPLGFAGITLGAVGVVGALKGAVDQAADFGANVANVASVTNLAIPVASAMVDTLDKWGVSSDRLIPLLGKLEKNVGTIAATSTKGGTTTEQLTKAREKLALAQVKLNEVEGKSKSTASQRLTAQQRVADATRNLADLQAKVGKSASGAAAFQKEYGVSLLDSKGHIADANTLLIRSADYFNSNATATQKATFLSKLYGKGWQDLVPILSKGSKFIRDQEKDAIQLSQSQLDNITKYRNAARDFADTWGDVQVKVGATVMPGITDIMTSFSGWLDTHSQDLVDFFQGGLDGARNVAAFVTGTVIPTIAGLAGTAKSFWEGIPPELRDILVKGFIADRTIHFLFGLSPGKLALDLGGNILGPIVSKLAGGIFERGGSAANPMWVQSADPFGLGSAGGTGGWALVGTIIGGAFAIVAAAEIADLIHQQISPDGGYNNRVRDDKLLPADQLEWPFGPKNTPRIDLGPFKDILMLDPRPEPGQARSAGGSWADTTAADMERRRNAIESGVEHPHGRLGRLGRFGLSPTILAQAEERPRGSGPAFITTAKLDASQIRDLRDPYDHSADAIEKVRTAIKTGDDHSYDAIEKLRAKSATDLANVKRATDAGTTAVTSGLQSAQAGISGAIFAIGAQIVAAVVGSQPTVNVGLSVRDLAHTVAVSSIRSTVGTGPTSGSGV